MALSSTAMRRHAFASLALASLAVALPARPAGAQPQARALSKPDKVFDASFTTISGLRELRDGRVIVSDFTEKTLQVLDPRTDEATPVGRMGAGPAEWGFATRLYALAGDSTLMSDPSNGRYLIIGPDGRPVTTFRLPDGSAAAFASLVGVDARGGMVFERQRPSATPGPRSGSTGIVDILRYDRTTQRTDTIGGLDRPKGEISFGKMEGAGIIRMVTSHPFAPLDVSVVAPDGRVAIVRGVGYRIDWIGPDGRLTKGPAAEAAQVRVTAAEREAFIKGQTRGGAIVTSGAPQAGSGSSGATRIGGAPAGGAMQMPAGAFGDPEQIWPAMKPPFLAGAASVAPDGRVWVQRSRAHDDLVPVYDVFDASGKVVERITLPAGTRLVGLGRDMVYVSRADEDDLLQLERYRLR